MAEQKMVQLIAGAHGIWTGTERIEPGQPFAVAEAQAKRLVAKGAARPVQTEGEPKKGSRSKQGAQEADKETGSGGE